MSCISRAVFVVSPMCVAVLSASSASAVGVDVQAPCSYTSGVCSTFNGTLTTAILRTYSFKRTRSGKALLTFQGAIHCSNHFSIEGVVDLVGQILTQSGATPNYQQPGGVRFAVTFPGVGQSIQHSKTMLVNVSREVDYTANSTKAVVFKILNSRVDAGIRCSVFNASFTAVFTE